MRTQFLIASTGLLLIVAAASAVWPPAWLSLFIILPLIGSVNAAGKTVTELQEDVSTRLKEKYLQSPEVTIYVKEFASQKVTVEGAVVQPGVYPITGRTTLLQALAISQVSPHLAPTDFGVLGALLLAGLLLFASDVFLEILGKDATLTGRTKIWAAALRQAELRPWTGYGYSAVWDDKTGWGPLAWITKEAGFKPSHAHNAWLEQWLGLGYTGVLAWALFYLQTMGGAIAAVFSRPGAYLALPFLVIYSLLTLTESVAVTLSLTLCVRRTVRMSASVRSRSALKPRKLERSTPTPYSVAGRATISPGRWTMMIP